MIFLILAFALLALAYRRLLSQRSAAAEISQQDEKPSVYRKLVSEAFEHSDPPPSSTQTHPILFLYATEYGFASTVARTVASNFAEANNLHSSSPALLPRVVNILHYNLIDFAREHHVALICSTTGDGVPPNEAAAFRDALTSRDLVIPNSTRLSILALGDRAYPHFCRAAAILDDLLPSSERLLERVDVDQEDWTVINDWADRLRASILSDLSTNPTLISTPATDYLRAAIDKHADSLSNSQAQYTRANPYQARIHAMRVLTAPKKSSEHKEVIRVEFDLTDSSLQYDVGDALAVIPSNNPKNVNNLLLQLAVNGHELVRVSGVTGTTRLDDALTNLLDLRVARAPFVAILARRSSSAHEMLLARKILGHDPRDPAHRPRNATATEFGREYFKERDVGDIISDFISSSLDPQTLVDHLRPLHARYYSISSAPARDADRVAITVDVLRFETLGIEREGVASTFLRDRCVAGETQVGIFVSRNPNFRLPVDDTRPIVMIGPGTGVAPFVGFLQEREARVASGENWLFFGCRFENQDFLYREELLQMAERGVLQLRTAFSRDGPHKVYVQDRLREEAAVLWKLIDEESAHVYICGDGGKMAGDVDHALQEIVSEHGSMSKESAAEYLDGLSQVKRYQKDVWVP